MADFEWVIPNFNGGMNTRMDPALLEADEAQAITDGYMDQGVLLPLKDAGTALTGRGLPLASGSTWADYVSNCQWVGSTLPAYAVHDGSRSFVTNPGYMPNLYYPWATVKLGISAPVVTTYSATGSGSLNGSYQYAFTYKNAEGVESNPLILPAMSFTNQLFQFTGPANNDINNITQLRVWRTQASGTIFYLAQTINLPFSGTVLTDSGASVDTTQQLTWNVILGTQGAAQYTVDHSPPPPLEILSNGFHGTGNVSGASGVLFGGIGNTLYWSLNGYPTYWPVNNSVSLDSPIEAIITGPGQTMVFTQGAIYTVTGPDDAHMTSTRSSALFSCRPGTGRAVCVTPFGTMLLTRRGIEIFDGDTTYPLSMHSLKQSVLDGLTVNWAAFWDNRYHIFHSAGTLIADMRHFPLSLYALRMGITKDKDIIKFSQSSLVAVAKAKPLFPNTINARAQYSYPNSYRRITAAQGSDSRIISGGNGGFFFKADFQGPNDALASTTIQGVNFFGVPNGMNAVAATSTLTAPRHTIYAPLGIGPNASVGFLMIIGGSTDSTVTNAQATVVTYNLTSAGLWSTVTPSPAMPAVCKHAVDCNMTQSTGTTLGAYYYGGVNTSGTALATLNTMTLTSHGLTSSPTAAYANIGTYTGNERYNASMVVDASVGTGGSDMIYVFGGVNANGAVQNTMLIIDLGKAPGSQLTVDNSGTALGLLPRMNANMWMAANNRYLFVHGGEDAEGTGNKNVFSDVWLYDTQLPGFLGRVAQVLNLGPRSETFALVNKVSSLPDSVWVLGGSTTVSAYGNDMWMFSPESMYRNIGLSEQLYVVKSGQTSPRPWNSGSALSASWQTGEFTGGDQTVLKTFERLILNGTGTITVTATLDGASPVTVVNAATLTRSKPNLFYFPPYFEGYRCSLTFTVGSGAELHAARVEGEIRDDDAGLRPEQQQGGQNG